MSKTRQTLYPNYLAEFQCIGANCEDTCCAGWTVLVDKKTYQKYMNVKEPHMKAKLKENVKRDRSRGSEAAYAKIKMDEKGACTFLEEDQLCGIYKELGEDYLCNTCTVYPRNLQNVMGVVEKSLTPSCPEAARLMLLNRGVMQFTQETEPADVRGNVKNRNLTRQQEQIFWDLRIFTIQLLQNRNYSIESRLIILGLFLNRLENIPADSRKEKLAETIDLFSKSIADGSLQKSIEQLPNNISFQIEAAKALMKERASKAFTNEQYVACFNEMIQGLELNKNLPDEEKVAVYKEAYENYYKPFMTNHEYIWENYLVNYVFSNMFPYNMKSFTHGYLMLIINFMLLKMHLIGAAKVQEKLDEDTVIRVFYSFSRAVDHNAVFLAVVEDMFEEAGYTSLAHMVVLVKS